jgi:hypothetical protein
MKTFQITDDQLRIILAALAAQPYQLVAALIQDLHRQATAEEKAE